MEEIWKVITDSDGHYFISNMGRMKRDSYMFLDKAGRKINVIGEILGKGTHNRKVRITNFKRDVVVCV